MSVIRILKNRNFIFILAFVLGLSIGHLIGWIRYLTLPALAVVMVVSLTQISIRSFLPLKSIVKPLLLTIILNYFIFALVMLLMAWFIIPDRELWIGFVIIAFAPPGVAIAPFTGIIGGDVRFSLAGVIGAYIAALAIIPISGIILIGQSFIQPLQLVIIFLELIIAPIVLSQIFIKKKIDKYILRFKGPIVNWGLFVVIFTVIGLNRNVFFSEPVTLAKISLICFTSVIGMGFLYELLTRRLKLDPSIILLGVVKNGGFAAATALALFGDRASLPSAVVSVFLVIFLLYLSFRTRKR
jgi:BASS family bile acid:Na+ symporter